MLLKFKKKKNKLLIFRPSSVCNPSKLNQILKIKHLKKKKNLDQTKLSKNMNQMEPKWVKSVQFKSNITHSLTHVTS